MNYKLMFLKYIFPILFFFSSCKQHKHYDPEEVILELISSYPNPMEDFELIDIDCDKVNDILFEIYQEDQDVRHTGDRDRDEVDAENLQKFVSLVEQCGFPNKDQIKDGRGKIGIFLVLQHASPEWIAHYYQHFKESTESGLIAKDFLGYLQDRFLLHHQKPQIYGTQLKNGKLYNLYDPLNVNKRRKKMGFKEDLETYLNRHGLDYTTEINSFLNE